MIKIFIEICIVLLIGAVTFFIYKEEYDKAMIDLLFAIFLRISLK